MKLAGITTFGALLSTKGHGFTVRPPMKQAGRGALTLEARDRFVSTKAGTAKPPRAAGGLLAAFEQAPTEKISFPIRFEMASLERFDTLVDEVRDALKTGEEQTLKFDIEVFNDFFSNREFHIKSPGGEYLFQAAATHGRSLVVMAERVDMLSRDGTMSVEVKGQEVLITKAVYH